MMNIEKYTDGNGKDYAVVSIPEGKTYRDFIAEVTLLFESYYQSRNNGSAALDRHYRQKNGSCFQIKVPGFSTY